MALGLRGVNRSRNGAVNDDVNAVARRGGGLRAAQRLDPRLDRGDQGLDPGPEDLLVRHLGQLGAQSGDVGEPLRVDQAVLAAPGGLVGLPDLRVEQQVGGALADVGEEGVADHPVVDGRFRPVE